MLGGNSLSRIMVRWFSGVFLGSVIGKGGWRHIASVKGDTMKGNSDVDVTKLTLYWLENFDLTSS